MGLYVLLSDWSIQNMQEVSDQELNELFKEAKDLDPSLLISEYKIQNKKKWFKKPSYETSYIIYHECFNSEGQRMMEARQMFSGSGGKRIVEAYLYGIINGINHNRETYGK